MNTSSNKSAIEELAAAAIDPDAYAPFDIAVLIGYVIFGAGMFFGGLAVALPISRHYALRSKTHYLVIAALTFADAFDGECGIMVSDVDII